MIFYKSKISLSSFHFHNISTMLTKSFSSKAVNIVRSSALISHNHLVLCDQTRIRLSNFKSVTPYRCKYIDSKPHEESQAPKRKNFRENLLPPDWMSLIQRYPEFLPDPINYSSLLVYRSVDDMLQRRTVIEIPEFYVGSVLAVTVSDNNSETKRSRFVGICVHRTGQLKYANFTLRNVIDGCGVEIRYDLYSPLILSIDVLKFEKRLDDSLIYLRDAPQEYSTFPEDMKPQPYEEGTQVPVNNMCITLNPMPWSRRWDRFGLKGVILENVPQIWAERMRVNITENPVYSFDLMLEYRRHCTEEMLYGIFKRVAEHDKTVVASRREARSKRLMRLSNRLVVSESSTGDSETAQEEKG